MTPALATPDFVRVHGLHVAAHNFRGEDAPIVSDVSFSIGKGEVLALIGESGSGKTTIALALMGHTRAGCRITSGSVHIGSTDVLSLGHKGLLDLRGREVSYIAQSAAASFNPARPLLDQVIESARTHGMLSRAQAEAKAIEMFRSLSLPEPELIGRRYPHQLSGGQLQRMMAVMALITDPKLVILDEPTTALDVTTQIDVLRSFKKLLSERGTSAIYVSHDLPVVAQMADHIVVLNCGRIRENGRCEELLSNPQDPYTRKLILAAKPHIRVQPRLHVQLAVDTLPAPAATSALEIRGLVAGYGPIDAQGLPRKTVLRNVDLTLERGATLGVIGESGSGKSTLARVIAGLTPPAAGTITFNGKPLDAHIEGRTRDQLRRIQIVFQNADTALNPAHTVSGLLGRPLELYHGVRGAEREQRVTRLLDQVHLPREIARRRCGELSGGQKQRINLARALAAEPDLILCDEVTSALDTVVGAAVLDLLIDLRRELNLSYLFISHDISTVRSICDDVLVLYRGEPVESGAAEQVTTEPQHSYTALLMACVPQLRPGWLEEAPARHAPERSTEMP
jgi:peptide/nickel transport system ATP-binding protein